MRWAKQIALTIAFLLAASSSLRAQSHIPWVNNWQEASSLAQRYQHLVLIHFWSEHCPPCVKLERNVLNRPDVIRAVVSNYVPLKVNVDENAELARHFRVQQWPTDVIVTAQGVEVYRGASSQDPNRYTATLDEVAARTRIRPPSSSSRGTDVAAASRDSGSLNRASAFPVGVATGTPGTKPTPPPASPQYRGFTPLGSQTPPTRPQVPTRQMRSARSPETNRAAGGRTLITNQYVTRPPATALSHAHEQQVSFTSPSASQGQSPPPVPPYGVSTSSQPIANQFVSSGLGVPTESAASTAPNGAPVRRAVTQSPPGPAPQALDGYCSVTLVEQEKWVPGDPRWGAVHRGRTYLFAGPQEQQRFLADFDKYAPALSGFDCVTYAEQGRLVEGNREHGIFYRGQIFLFADESALKKFWGAPPRYVPIVQAEQDRQAARRQ